MEKKRFLFVSLAGLIGDIAWQVVKEGHEVRYYIDATDERDLADGFVPKTDDWEGHVEWAGAPRNDVIGMSLLDVVIASDREGARQSHFWIRQFANNE